MPKNKPQILKIAFVLDDGLDSPDGVQQYVLTLGRAMSKAGHEVHYIVGQTKRSDISNVHSLAHNIHVRFNGNRLTIPLPVSKSSIRRCLKSIDADVIHVQMPHSPFFGAKVVSSAPKSTVVIGTFHIFPYSRLARVGTRLLGIWLRRNLKRFDKFYSVSTAARDFAEESFKIETSISPNVVDIQRYRPAVPVSHTGKQIVRIVYVGRLVERKGCALLLQAYSKARSIDPSIESELIVCGRGEQRELLEKYVADNNLKSCVRFEGFVTEEEKIQHMQNADIAIFPSYAGESFGIVLIEAMAAGSHVVLGGDNPGYRSVMHRQPEALLDVCNMEQFAEQLALFIKDPAVRQKLHTKQQELVKEFDSEKVCGQLLKDYIIAKNHKRLNNSNQ